MGKMQAKHFASHGVNITFNEHEFVKDSTQEPPEIYHDQNTPFFIISGARRPIQFTTASQNINLSNTSSGKRFQDLTKNFFGLKGKKSILRVVDTLRYFNCKYIITSWITLQFGFDESNST